MNKRSAIRFALRSIAPIGEAIAMLGVAALCVGAALPWAQCKVFGFTIMVPGLFLGGAFTVVLGLLAVYIIRRASFVSALLGVGAIVIGVLAQQRVGRDVILALLRIENFFVPLNSHLAQAGIPPIESVKGIGPAVSYLGAGIKWTIWGGIGLTAGAAVRFVGQRVVRTCFHCGHAWSSSRSRDLRFCPHCGESSLLARALLCVNCYHPILRKDRFCITCGTATEKSLAISRDLQNALGTTERSAT